MTDGFQTTDQLVPVLTTDELMDKAAAMGSVIASVQHRQRQHESVAVIDKRAQAREKAAVKAQVAANIHVIIDGQ